MCTLIVEVQAENPVICTYMYVCMLELLTVIDEERLSSFPYPHLPTRLHWVQNTKTNALPNKSPLHIALTGSGPRGLSPAECTLLALALRALAGSSCSAGDQDKPLHGCPNCSARLGHIPCTHAARRQHSHLYVRLKVLHVPTYTRASPERKQLI